MPDQESNEQVHAGRRGFFRHGLRRMIRPLADFVETRMPDVAQEPPPTYVPVKARTLLRPPGALPEGDFLKTCYHSGNCLQVCPVSAIKQYKSDDSDQNNTPYIDADLAACIACEAVYCTKSCPSGALAVIHDRREIHIGLARVSEFECIRNRGEDCTICVEKCPIGRDALLLGEDGRIQVVASGCTGCGLCQQHCPTFPKAIVVDPR